MRDTSKHSEITKYKTIEEILESPESFETLLGMALLFNRDTDYFNFSGFVTAALLDYEGEDKNILAINANNKLLTFRWGREDLRKMFESCDAFIGKTEEESFLLKDGA